MRFHHTPAIWRKHPTLVAGALRVHGITASPDIHERTRPYLDSALRRLGERPVSEFPEIQAWRRAFAAMGLKPTQYRCAAESLLRRLHKDGRLPNIHPLVDLCNHVSASTAIPIAAIDLAHVTGDLDVRFADGTEQYAAFSGDVEHPAVGEVIFADARGQAHARRWTNRQSATSAIRDTTSDALIVIEALHDSADEDVPATVATLTRQLAEVWGREPRSALITAQRPFFLLDDTPDQPR